MFFISAIISLFYFICSIFINISWINSIACYFGYFLAIYLVTFIALIPGFNFVFMFINLLFCKKEKHTCAKKEEDVTVLIPVYNAKDSIKETIKSIKNQKYYGNIYINIIDDGSTDDSLKLLKSMEEDSNIRIIEVNHAGKALALDKGLQYVAGCIFVKNAKKNFITKLQEWDYSLGIFGVKLVQSNYNSTLVAQGAFSAYKTRMLKE